MAGVLQGLLLLPISSHLLLVQPPSSVSDSSVHPDCSPPGLPAPHHLRGVCPSSCAFYQ